MEVKFNQLIGKEDIYQYNLFYFQQKSKGRYVTYAIGIFAVALAVYSFIVKEYTTGAVWALLVIYSFVLQRYITKWQIRSAVNRRKELDNPITIEVSIDDEGIMYHLPEENEPRKLTWENVREVYDYKNFWYIYYGSANAIFIRKSDCPNQNSVEEFLKEKLPNQYKKK